MKIGVFDSGLGGMVIMGSLAEALPQYDYVYLGDAARVPYGNRSHDLVYQFTVAAVDYLFAHGCGLIIVACNTASAEALRRVQQEYLPTHYPNRRVLGVLIPTAEAAADGGGRVGVLATAGTVASKAYVREIHKLAPHIEVVQAAAPLLVPIIESGEMQWIDPILESYLQPLLDQHITKLILGCTHYPVLKEMIRGKVGDDIRVLSQDEIIPSRLADYLQRNHEIAGTLSTDGTREFLVTDVTPGSRALANQLYGVDIDLLLVNYPV